MPATRASGNSRAWLAKSNLARLSRKGVALRREAFDRSRADHFVCDSSLLRAV